MLSAVEFDTTGEFLATGDKGGRIVLFKRADVGQVSSESDFTGLPYHTWCVLDRCIRVHTAYFGV